MFRFCLAKNMDVCTENYLGMRVSGRDRFSFYKLFHNSFFKVVTCAMISVSLLSFAQEQQDQSTLDPVDTNNTSYIIPAVQKSIDYQQLLETEKSSKDTYSSIPQIGDSASSEFSLEDEFAIGQSWLSQLRQSSNLIDDPFIIDYIEQMLSNLAAYNNQLQEYRFSVVVLDDTSFNAFAAPGGIIGVNAGLFKHSDDEAGFASVMAHELAHLSQRHFARRQQRGGLSAGSQLLIFLASLLLARENVNTDVVQAGLLGASSLVIDRQLAYSRSDEEEADRVGFETFIRAGYAPIGVVKIFQSLAQQSNSRIFIEYLSTHPNPHNRVADFSSRFSLKRQNEGLLNTLMFQMLKLRVRNMSSEVNPQNINTLRRSIDRKLEAKVYDAHLVMQYYLLASQYKAEGNYVDALTAYQEGRNFLKRSSPAFNVFLADEAILLLSLDRTSEILPELISQYEFTNKNYPLSMTLAKVYQANDNYVESGFILRDLRRRRLNDPYVWQALSNNHSALKDLVNYNRSLAEFYALTGEIGRAIEYLHVALDELEEKDWTTRVEIENRLETLGQTVALP